MRFRRVFLYALLIIFTVSAAAAQVPQKTWRQYKTPEEAGFSSEKLAAAKKIYDKMGAAAYMAVVDGKVLVSWGDVERRFWLHSCRKSLLSALYGIHSAEGTIDLNKTLADYKVTDTTAPTKEELQAKIIHLLKARSGVYIPAAAETQGMKARRPKRGSHSPDTFWYYNNWDFNVLGTILERQVGTDIFTDFKKRIGDPVGMEDFEPYHGMHYVQPEYSKHAAYHFRMTARDLARFGLLFLHKGKWNGKQIIPEKWVKESATAWSQTGRNGLSAGYGYLWWTSNDEKTPGMFSALGVGTQMIAVIPSHNMVMIQRVNTYARHRAAPRRALIHGILDAKIGEPKADPKLISLQNTPSVQRPPLLDMKPEILAKYAKDYPAGDAVMKVMMTDGHLRVETPGTDTYRLLPVTASKFIMEDEESFALFELAETGKPVGLTLFLTPGLADLYADINKMGPEAAVKAYRIKQRAAKAMLVLTENELNNFGYQLLRKKEFKAAIEVFALNTALYPKSANTFDSLGEAYMIAGDRKNAIKYYRKVLELDPNNKNAEEKLEQLKKN